MHVVMDELNNGSSGELIFILMQIQNSIKFSKFKISKFSKFVYIWSSKITFSADLDA